MVQIFSPILMGRDRSVGNEDEGAIGVDDEENEPSGELPNVNEIALLPPDLQQSFLRNRWIQSQATRQSYVLDRNLFLVVDPALRIALDVVREKNRGTREERRSFVRNPRSAIAEALPDEDGDVVSAALFVETQQYSERVRGLEVWAPPKIPWLNRKPQQWLPEKFEIAPWRHKSGTQP